MRRIFQNEWQGVYFKDLTEVSADRLASVGFYKLFYKYLLTKFRDWRELDPEWLRLKLQTADFLNSKFSKQKNIKIVSIGCGLGVIEKALIDDGYDNLDITEGTEEPLEWIRRYVAKENIFIGVFPDCVPTDRAYDIIYLAGVEYCLNQEELVSLLKQARSRLSKNGKFILISWSFEPPSIMGAALALSKDIVRYILEVLCIRARGQFWGYSRNRNEFIEAMNSAGFNNINDGIFTKETRWDTYWIEGNN